MKEQEVKTSTETESFLVTNLVVNGNNSGSLLANKEYHICYSVVSNDLKGMNKKLIGCFLNPNDLCLDKSIDNNLYYFQIILSLERQFTVSDLLKNTLYSRYYSNHIAKRILKDGDEIIKKIIAKCEEEIKAKY